jgi:3-(3-hydroxy-phenyl)propionate hydroxylase
VQKTFTYPKFDFVRPPELADGKPGHYPVVVVGAGPVGLSAGHRPGAARPRVLLLDNDHRLSSGSRAICFAKRALEIWDRLGVGQRMVDKGVSWSVGRVFFGSQQVYQFDMLPEPGHERPAFINLQQYYAEGLPGGAGDAAARTSRSAGRTRSLRSSRTPTT